jgi:hypothetical protein
MTETLNTAADVPPSAPDDTGPSPELLAFVDAVRDLPPAGITACPGRTVFRMACHMAGAVEEIDRHVVGYLAGTPVHRTRMFEEREEPYFTLSTPEVLDRLLEGDEALREHMAELLDREPDAHLTWTSRTVRAKGFLSHLRNECAVHRWDMVGDDEASRELLSQPDLLRHTVEFLGAIPLQARGIAAGAGSGRSVSYRLRAPGQDDLVVGVRAGEQELRLVPQRGAVLAEGDPAARHLLVWGRRAQPFSRMHCLGDPDELRRLQMLLAGY